MNGASTPVPNASRAPIGRAVDAGLIAALGLAVALAALILWTFVQTPAAYPFPNLNAFLRIVRAALTLALVAALLWILVRRTRRVERSDLEARLLLALPVGALLLVDDAGTVRSANAYVEQLLRIPIGELVGRPFETLFPPERRPNAAGLLASSREARSGVRVDLEGTRGDGSTLPLEVVVVSTSVQGRTTYGVYLRDLTEREDLVRALTDRAAELARSNRELEQFAYVASHDLQEPLRMVGSYTQLLAQRYGEKLDSDAREFLGFAQEGATRMRQLIDDLLAFSRIGTRGQAFRRLALDGVVDTALKNLSVAIADAHAEIRRAPLPEIDGDATQLVQVFQNLLGNALKFRGPTPPHIAIEAQRVGSDVELVVRDDGIGIAPQYQEKIFEIFQRLHSREEYPGSGIGLAVVKKVVERHGGRIWVESSGRPGEGTAFHFTLRAEAARAPSPPRPSPSASSGRAGAIAQSLIEERLRSLV